MYYVYAYSVPSKNNEIIYVGKGKDNRAWDHLKRRDVHPLTHRLEKMLKNGVVPNIKMMCENVDDEFAQLVEMELIAKYGRKDLGRGPLLNLTDGGEGSSGRIATEEFRKNMSAAKIGKTYGPIARENYRLAAIKRGRQFMTPERNAKISLGLSGHGVSQETRKKISEKAKIHTAGDRNGMFNKKHSEESKKKMSEKRKAFFAAKKASA